MIRNITKTIIALSYAIWSHLFHHPAKLNVKILLLIYMQFVIDFHFMWNVLYIMCVVFMINMWRCHCFCIRKSSNKISDNVSMFRRRVGGLKLVVCKWVWSQLTAPEKILMLGSHAFSSGRCQTAAGSICVWCSNLPLHGSHIENWIGQAYIHAAFDNDFLVVPFPLAKSRFHPRGVMKGKSSILNTICICFPYALLRLF